jgi:hypothetical protein
VLEQLTAEHGIDFATAVLYDRLSRRPDVAELYSQYVHEPLGNSGAYAGGHMAIVPGALYREHPHTGADGRVVLAEARRLGWYAELIPLSGSAAPQENAARLCEWLQRQPHGDLVLVSLSKGGADVKWALTLPEAAEAFDRVCGWISFGGILDGAPMVEWACSRWFTRAWYRAACRIGGYDFEAFKSLRRRECSPLSFPLRVPAHMVTVHVVGVPLRQHLSSARAKRWHRRLSRWGPNDSVTLLADVLRWPGIVFPVWGTDHYWQDRWDARRLVPFLLGIASRSKQSSIRSA